MPTVGEIVKSLRVARGLSQDELGARVGASQRHLSFIETGRVEPARSLLLRIVIELGVSYADTVRLLKAAGYTVSATPPGPSEDEIPEGFKQFADRLLSANPVAPAVLVDERLRVVRMNGSMAGLLTLSGTVEEFFEGAYMSFPACVLHPGGLCAMLTDPEQGAADFIQFLLRLKLKGPEVLGPVVSRALTYPLVASTRGRIEPSKSWAREGYELGSLFRNIRVRPTVMDIDNPIGSDRFFLPKYALWTATAADERSKRVMATWSKAAMVNVHDWLTPYWAGRGNNKP